MSGENGNRKWPSRTSLVAVVLFVLPAVYVLSYAPVFRFASDNTYDFDFFYPPRERWQDLYVPVEWLTDNTPIREPLLKWAALWGESVESDFRYRSDHRMQGEDPYLGFGGGGYGRWDDQWD